MKLLNQFLAFLIFVFCISGCNVSVNKSIHIGNGETVRNSLNTVNGSIIIGSECKIYSNCRTVNGRIEVGKNSEVQQLQTVNGRIEIGTKVAVHGDLETVNGSVTCEAGVQVEGGISTINGSIDLENTTVERDITSYNGNITLADNSILQGDIIINKSKGSSDRIRRLKIRIKQKSVIEGDIIVKDKNMDVRIFLLEGGKVKGRIKNAELIEEEI